MIYRFKEGRGGFGVSAQVAGERIEEIRHSKGEDFSAGDVVDDARPEASPLHEVFEWDDVIAAELHREHTARRLINSIVVKQPAAEVAAGGPKVVQAYVSTGNREAGSRYTTVARAFSEPELREHVLSVAIATLKGWQRRFGHLQELAELHAAVERELERVEEHVA